MTFDATGVPGAWKKPHLGCGVGWGFLADTYDVSDFEEWSWGFYAAGGVGAGITAFVEGKTFGDRSIGC
jgi:hypothetical protein